MGIWGDFQGLTEATGGGRGGQKPPKLRQRRLWMVPKGAFTIYVYNARWVGGQKFGKFVSIHRIKIVNEGSWVVKNV